MANGQSIDSVAKKLKAHRRTVDGWVAQDEFKEALNNAVDEIFTAALNQAAGQAEEAVKQLFKVVTDEKTTDANRLKAIQVWFDIAWKRRELNLDKRLAEIEAKLNGQSG